ncbi:MAG: hypothetical protein KC415_15550, partial [Anaerolineales bacterium]|nr:hypothetical protein [Anaerolineales bacterium]
QASFGAGNQGVAVGPQAGSSTSGKPIHGAAKTAAGGQSTVYGGRDMAGSSAGTAAASGVGAQSAAGASSTQATTGAAASDASAAAKGVAAAAAVGAAGAGAGAAKLATDEVAGTAKKLGKRKGQKQGK